MPYQRIIFTFLFMLTTLASSHADLQNGLIRWWKFDESSGNAVDSSSRNKTGTPTGTTILSNCKRAGCRSFNGTTDYVNSDNTLGFSDTTFTVAAWIKTTGTANMYTISQQGNAANIGGWGVGVNNVTANKFGLTLKSSGGQNPHQVASLSSVNDGNWHHVCAVMTTSTTVSVNNTSLIYVDGILDQDVSAGDGAAVYAATTESAKIGGRTTSGALTQPYSGEIDDIRVYNRALSAQEIKELSLPGVVIANGVVANGKIDQ